jgi:glutamate carboxypeptidase
MSDTRLAAPAGAATPVTAASVQVAQAVAARCASELDSHLEAIVELARIDSGADAPEGVARVVDRVAELLPPGADTRFADLGGARHLYARLPGSPSRVVLLTHADTVFPAGTGARRPPRLDGDRLLGPGVADMKGGIVLALAVCRYLRAVGAPTPTIDLVVVGDEERRTSAVPFLAEMAAADACLVLECGRPQGGYVAARKAGAWLTLAARGRAAHGGVAPPPAARNALVALCRQVVRIAELDGARPGLSVTVGTLSAGWATNAVPGNAEATFDVRGATAADVAWALEQAAKLDGPPGVMLAATASGIWPALEPTAPTWRLAGLYGALAGALAVPAFPVATGGMSDGNWVAQAGVPTLDGLGPVGDLDHTLDEYLLVPSFPPRAGQLAGLLVELGGSSAGQPPPAHGRLHEPDMERLP